MKRACIVCILLFVFFGSVGVALAEERFLAGGGYNPHEMAFALEKRVSLEVIFTDLEKNEVNPLPDGRLLTIKEHMDANQALKDEIVSRLQKGEQVSIGQYGESLLILREELRRQFVEKGFAVVKEGTPNVFRIKVYGAQKGGSVSYVRFTGIVVDGVSAAGKKVFTYDAGVLYESLSNRRQEELIKDKIAPSLVNILGAAFNRMLIKK